MSMQNDAELLRRYAEERAEDAFAGIVRRHLTLVYSVALRQVGGDAHLAQDVTQRVFVDLARKARALASHAVLGGWLYRAAHFAATDVVRAERRRRAREQEAHLMQEISSNPSASADWEKVRPVLDEAISELGESDRDAVVLRFFEGRPFAEIGAALQVKEDAARMRVERALEKLRDALARRGLKSTAAALGLALANQTGATAPIGLAAVVTGAAIATRVGWLTSAVKLQIAVAAGVVAAALAVFVAQRQANEGMRDEVAELQRRREAIAALRAENQALARVAAEVEMLRQDDVEFARLRDEAAALREDLKRRERERAAKAVARTVIVAGKINRPSRIEVPADGLLTLGELLRKVGGLAETAKGTAVRVTRMSPDAKIGPDTAGRGTGGVATASSMRIFTLDATGSDASFVIESNDIVYVPERIF